MSPSVAMNVKRCSRAVALVVALAAVPARAQLTPNVGYVYPAGGRQGTTLTVAIGGQWLEKTERVMITGEGVKAEIVEYIEPDWRKLQRLREEANRLEGKQQGDRKDNSADRPKGDRADKPTPELRRLRKEIREITRRNADP